MQNRGVVFIDIDGTMNVFKPIDACIIYKIFGNYRLVMFCDKLLWKINELDFISNSMYIFKFRIWFYSILSFTSFKKNLKEYESEYLKFSFEEVEQNFHFHLSKLKEIGYTVFLVTHNKFTKAFGKNLPIIILRNKPKYIKKFHKKNQVVYMLGNNYTDDLRIPIKLGIDTIYIGRSNLVKKMIVKKAKHFESLKEAIEYIVDVSKE